MGEGQLTWRDRAPFLAASIAIVLLAGGIGWAHHARAERVPHQAPERVALLRTPMPAGQESLLPFAAEAAAGAPVVVPESVTPAPPVRRHRTARD